MTQRIAVPGPEVILAGAFFIFVLFFGGASRADALNQPVIRIGAALVLAWCAFWLNGDQWSRVRAQMLFLIACAIAVAIQLVPIPPDLWAALPGRADRAAALDAAGIGPVWRPLSLTPDFTLNTLLAFLVPMAAVMTLALVEPRDWPALLPFLVGGIIISSIFGVLQISGGEPYFYRVTNVGFGVGVFANRNHQAVLLAAGYPLLACWAAVPARDVQAQRVKTWLALCCAAALFPLLLITGSRAGFVLGVAGAVLALVLVRVRSGDRRSQRRFLSGRMLLMAAIPVGIGVASVVAAFLLQRDIAFHRLFNETGSETRSVFLPVYWQMIRDFFPFGSGFGSFDPVFRSYEPENALVPTYMNQAHNDWAQIVIEGGLLASLLALAFVIWLGRQAWRLARGSQRSAPELLGRSGGVIVLLLLLSSAVDYPLRTPLLSALMAIACVWIGGVGNSSPDADDALGQPAHPSAPSRVGT